MVEHHDALGAALGFNQLDHLRIVNALDLVFVVEIGDLGVMAHEAEAVALQLKILGVRPAVMDRHRVRVRVAAAARVAAAWRGDDGVDRGAIVDDVVKRCLDGIGGNVELGSLGHDQLLCKALRLWFNLST